MERGSRVHFVGVGGIGMSGLASVLLSKGAIVSGSDLQSNRETLALSNRGASIQCGHSSELIHDDLDCLIVSSAIPPDHAEVLEARRRRIPVVPRLDAVSQLLQGFHSIGIAGTHGKTSTTAMVATILRDNHQRPSYLIGADCPDLGGNACLDEGEWLAAEIDESDGLLVDVATEIAVLTNIGRDHVQTYRDLASIEEAFSQYLSNASAQVLCVDDPCVARLAASFPKAITVGIETGATLEARNLVFDRWETRFELFEEGEARGRVRLPAPGRHNVRNALCALAAACLTGLSLTEAVRGLARFQLPSRRFELLEENGVIVVDDYAHLPEEIEATLAAIRSGWPGRRIVAVFQPHRYSRTQALGHEFGGAFARADLVIVNPIYSACEARIPGISSQSIMDAIRRDTDCRVRMLATADDTLRFLESSICSGDFIISFGAGDVWRVTESLARILEEGRFPSRVPAMSANAD